MATHRASRSLTNSNFMQAFSEPYLADIGRVVCAWSHCEQQFLLLFLSFVAMKGASSGSTKRPEVLTLMGLPLDRQVKAFRERLVDVGASKEFRESSDRILDRLLNLRRARDEMAHSSFWADVKDRTILPDSAIGMFKRWKSKKEMTHKRVTRARLKSLFNQLHALFWDFFDFAMMIRIAEHAKGSGFIPRSAS